MKEDASLVARFSAMSPPREGYQQRRFGRLEGSFKMWLSSNEAFESVSGQRLRRNLESTLDECVPPEGSVAKI